MNPIFKKSNLEQINKVIHHTTTGRGNWELASKIIIGEDFSQNYEAAIILLERGAYSDDIWSMCQLARELFYHYPERLPTALSWWKKAAGKGDEGALCDLKALNQTICERIKNFNLRDRTEYATIEIRCAMMTEFILTRLGQDKWNELSSDEKHLRITHLIHEASLILDIIEPKFKINPSISPFQGLAHPDTWLLEICPEILSDYERLIQVIFHELGHFVVFSMWDNNPKSIKLRERFGIDENRVNEWYCNKPGISVPVTEEDPDTLSYGVYTIWGIYFL